MYTIAHRGYSSKYKDNSEEAFLKALEYPIEMIETDLRMNRNREWVLYHDSVVKLPSELSMEKVEKDEYWISKLSTTQCLFLKILTLKYFLDLMLKYAPPNFKLYFDIKGHPHREDLNLLIYILSRHSFTQSGLNVYLASFNYYVVKELIDLRIPSMFSPFQYNIGRIGDFYPPYDENIYELDFISSDQDQVDGKYINRIRKLNNNLKIFVYTINDSLSLEYFQFQLEVDGILSDEISIFFPPLPLPPISSSPPPSPAKSVD